MGTALRVGEKGEYGAWSHFGLISTYVKVLRDMQPGRLLIGPLYELPDGGYLLADGCHRASALYLLDPPSFPSLDVPVRLAPEGMLDLHPELRQ